MATFSDMDSKALAMVRATVMANRTMAGIALTVMAAMVAAMDKVTVTARKGCTTRATVSRATGRATDTAMGTSSRTTATAATAKPSSTMATARTTLGRRATTPQTHTVVMAPGKATQRRALKPQLIKLKGSNSSEEKVNIGEV